MVSKPRKVLTKYRAHYNEFTNAARAHNDRCAATGGKFDRGGFVHLYAGRKNWPAHPATLYLWLQDVIGPAFTQPNRGPNDNMAREQPGGATGPFDTVDRPDVGPAQPHYQPPASFHDLVPIAPTRMGGEAVDTVNARDLHAALMVGRVFASWIAGRIEEYGFIEGRDFVTVSRLPIPGSGNRGAATDYFITLDMAKELGMVEKNDAGRAIRRHFIECERIARNATHTLPAGPSKNELGRQQAAILGTKLGQVEENADARAAAMHAHVEMLENRMERMELHAEQVRRALEGGLVFAATWRPDQDHGQRHAGAWDNSRPQGAFKL